MYLFITIRTHATETTNQLHIFVSFLNACRNQLDYMFLVINFTSDVHAARL